MRSLTALLILMALCTLGSGCKQQPEVLDSKAAVYNAELAPAPYSHYVQPFETATARGGTYEVTGLSANEAVTKVEPILEAAGFVQTEAQRGSHSSISFLSRDHNDYFIFRYTGSHRLSYEASARRPFKPAPRSAQGIFVTPA